jgi:hypothetical protein
VERFKGPARTRGHPGNLWGAWASKAAPTASEPPTAAHGCTVPQPRRPAHLTPPYRVPLGGTGAIRDQEAGTGLAQHLASPSPAA